MDRKVIVIKHRTSEPAKLAKGEGSFLNGDAWLHPEIFEEDLFLKKIRHIIVLISQKKLISVNNFYEDSFELQFNLEKYLSALFWKKPDYLFIGEAPGIHGCALSGIPFTSERVINEGAINHHFDGTRFSTKGNSYELSAKVIWEMINQMVNPPVLWNVFPLNPYKVENGVMKNRTPNSTEKQWGRGILQKVIELFPHIKIVTIGNHAREACEKLGIATFDHIIHPAHHINEFREQFRSKILSQH